MFERWVLISKDPYTEAAEIIEQWAKRIITTILS